MEEKRNLIAVFLFLLFVSYLILFSPKKINSDELPWKQMSHLDVLKEKVTPIKLPEPLPFYDGIYLITNHGYVDITPFYGGEMIQ